MKRFDYYSPRTISEACEILASHNGKARVMAGGTDLLLKMKAGTLRVAPKAIVNIKRIAELRREPVINHQSSVIRLDALTTLEGLRRSPVIREHCPALAHAAATMASVQIRNLATVGGNLCNAAPSADLAPILIALNAVACIAGPPARGDRCILLQDFFTGPGLTVLAPGELLVSLEVPLAAPGAVYLKHAPRECMDIAVVGIGLSLSVDDERCRWARVVLGAVAPTPMRARRAEEELLAGPLTPERIERAAKIAAEESKPIDDVRGSAWYRRQMVEVMTRRGLVELTGNARI
ncbi:MAG: xanthine dehydrogenase family protein subunit M [Chloroflexi bacterium]|nr:xanthine dehydrogenase family protein subunit M [Chloroflexota bacterium]